MTKDIDRKELEKELKEELFGILSPRLNPDEWREVGSKPDWVEDRIDKKVKTGR